MKLQVGGGGDFEKPKPGRYLGVLVGFYDIGTQPSTNPNYPARRRCVLVWELHKRKGPALDSKGRLLKAQSTYGLSLTDKSLLKPVAEVLIGRPLKANEIVDPRDWLGKSAALNIELTEDGKYANVAAVTSLDPEEDNEPEPSTPRDEWEVWSVDALKEDRDANVPGIVAKRVEKSEECQAARSQAASFGGPQTRTAAAAAAAASGDGDDIPF